MYTINKMMWVQALVTVFFFFFVVPLYTKNVFTFSDKWQPNFGASKFYLQL